MIAQAAAGEVPAYLAKLEAEADRPGRRGRRGAAGRAARRLHTHSDWSDGGSPIDEMARTARDLGHEYVVLTDHSPRLTVANGLSPERLRRQLDVVAELNERAGAVPASSPASRSTSSTTARSTRRTSCWPGSTSWSRSVHSKLRMDREDMTRRMVTAVANPHTDVLGHCTGRNVTPAAGAARCGRSRSSTPSSSSRRAGSSASPSRSTRRPERLDPPRRLLRLAVETGCLFSIDTDAHAPGQLDWQPYGCARAEECGVPADRVVNTWPADDLLAWTAPPPA